jgi:hypothetical protein
LLADTTTDDFQQFRAPIDLISERIVEIQNWTHAVLGEPIFPPE